MRRWMFAIAAVALAALLPGTAGAETPETPNVRIATASLGLPHLPLIIAERRKYFEAEGLKVEVAASAGGSKAQSLMGGSADVVSGAYSNTLTMAAKGQRLKNFAVQVRYPGLALGLTKSAAAKYKSLHDLKGMRVGVSAPGSSTHMIVAHILGKVGLKSEDISVIGVGTTAAAIAAVRGGEIDAICNSDPAITMLQTAGELTIIAEMRTAKGTEEVFGGPYPEASLYTTAEFIAKNPNTIQALANAITRAELWIATASPEDIAANVPPDFLLGDRALYLASFKAMRESLSPDGLITRDGAQNVHDVLAAFLPEVKTARIKLDDTYDNRFVEAALKKYRQ